VAFAGLRLRRLARTRPPSGRAQPRRTLHLRPPEEANPALRPSGSLQATLSLHEAYRGGGDPQDPSRIGRAEELRHRVVSFRFCFARDVV
jgi:hypothetical protein